MDRRSCFSSQHYFETGEKSINTVFRAIRRSPPNIVEMSSGNGNANNSHAEIQGKSFNGLAHLAVPILMYHKVGSPVRCKADHYINVPPRAFARQIDLLAHLGFEAVTFSQLIKGLQSGDLPPKPVCLTFDDAYQSVYDNVIPVLEPRGWKATLYVTTDYVGTENGWDRKFGKPLAPIMDWVAIRNLHSLGWEIGAHTCSHPYLDELDTNLARHEIGVPKAIIESQTDAQVETFCYPFGRYSNENRALVAEAGYIGACTTHKQWATVQHDPFLMPRLAINRGPLHAFLYRVFVQGRSTRNPARIPFSAPPAYLTPGTS